MGIFDPIIKILDGLAPDGKKLLTALLWLLAVFFVIKPAQGVMKNFGNKRWGEGFLDLVVVGGIVAVAIIIPIFVFNLGKATGDKLNENANTFNYLNIMFFLPLFYLLKQNFNRNKSKLKV